MTCTDCGRKPAESGRDICFRCRVKGVGFRLQGGGVIGSNAFHQTRRDWIKEHTGANSEKDLAKSRPDVERA